MDLQLTNKTVLATAASKGLGFSTAKTLADEGANVIICGRTEESQQEAVTTIGNNAQYVVADVSKREEIDYLLKQVEAMTSKLDGLFLNAGGASPGTFFSLTDDK